jgi:hypothetical protein
MCAADLGDETDPATRIALAIDQLGGRLTAASTTADPASIGAALRRLALSGSTQQRGELLAPADRVVELSTA